MSKPRKKVWELNTDELAETTKEFDQENVGETFGPMTPEAEAAWEAAKRKPARGRPRMGRGVKVVSVGIEAGLLKRADAVAKKRGISRAKLVAEGLQAVLGERTAK